MFLFLVVDSMEAFELEEAMNAERTPGWAHDDWVYIEAPMQSIKRLAIVTFFVLLILTNRFQALFRCDCKI